MLENTFNHPEPRDLELTDNNHTMAAPPMPYIINAAGLSDIGLVRQNNEDVWAEVPEIGLYVLADGMGGHQAGEVAARETVTAICQVLKRKIARSRRYTLHELQALLKKAIMYVNAQVFKLGRSQEDLRGMGTTLCCLLFHSDGVAFGHVGDSRIYRLRKGKLDQLTRDHSLLRELVDQGQLNDRQVTDFLYKNIITKAIGTEPKVDPTVTAASVEEGDLYLMCSDGLSDLLVTDEIADILENSPTLEKAAESLVSTANELGGRDNITVVVIKIQGKNGE